MVSFDLLKKAGNNWLFRSRKKGDFSSMVNSLLPAKFRQSFSFSKKKNMAIRKKVAPAADGRQLDAEGVRPERLGMREYYQGWDLVLLELN